MNVIESTLNKTKNLSIPQNLKQSNLEPMREIGEYIYIDVTTLVRSSYNQIYR